MENDIVEIEQMRHYRKRFINGMTQCRVMFLSKRLHCVNIPLGETSVEPVSCMLCLIWGPE